MKKKTTVQRGFPALMTAAALLVGGVLAACSSDERTPAIGESMGLTVSLTAQIANDASLSATRCLADELFGGAGTDGTLSAGGGTDDATPGALSGTTRSTTPSAALSSTDLYTQFATDQSLTLFMPGAYRLNDETPVILTDATAVAATTTAPTGTRELTLTDAPYYWAPVGTQSFYAYYPSGLVTSRSGDDITLTVNSAQGATAAPTLTMPSGDLDADVLYAESKDMTVTPTAVPLTFYHRMSKVTVVLQAGDGVTAAELEAAKVTLSGVYLSGKLTPATGVVAAITDDATNYPKGGVVIKNADNTAAENYCLLPPSQTLTGAELCVTVGGRELYYTIPQYESADVTLAAGKNYEYTLTVSSSAITAMSYLIMPWGVVNQAEETLTDSYMTMPLTIEAKTAGVKVQYKAKAIRTSKASVNGGAWSNWSLVENIDVSLPAVGDKVQFIGSKQVGTAKFTITGGNVKVYGNIMSLESGYIYSTGKFSSAYATDTEITDANAYKELFKDCTNLVDASGLVLPATTLTANCYESLFYGCTNLTVAPELPATTLAANCYQSMFYGCTALTKAPALPATTLAANCYQSMFYNCTALSAVPDVLPATELAESCYQDMFNLCKGLTTIPEGLLPATTLVKSCYFNMFSDCQNLTQSTALPATELAEACYRGMFARTKITSIELPATTLASQCYQDMFNAGDYSPTGWTSDMSQLQTIYIAAPYSNTNNEFLNWVYALPSSGTFYVKAANYDAWNALDRSESTIPSGWTVATY